MFNVCTKGPCCLRRVFLFMDGNFIYYSSPSSLSQSLYYVIRFQFFFFFDLLQLELDLKLSVNELGLFYFDGPFSWSCWPILFLISVSVSITIEQNTSQRGIVISKVNFYFLFTPFSLLRLISGKRIFIQFCLLRMTLPLCLFKVKHYVVPLSTNNFHRRNRGNKTWDSNH